MYRFNNQNNLNGLSGPIIVGGVAPGTGSTAIGAAAPIIGGSAAGAQQSPAPIKGDCPVTCKDVVEYETYYITDQNCPDCIPITAVTEKTIECDVPAPTTTQKKLDCNEVLAALKGKYQIDYAGGSSTMSGLGDCGCGCGIKGLGNSGSDTGGDPNYEPYPLNPDSKKDSVFQAGFGGLPTWVWFIAIGSFGTWAGMKFLANK